MVNNPSTRVAVDAGRAISDDLFSTLHPTAWTERPVAERHRLIFYLGHLEAFDWNSVVREPSLNARFETLFALGIDPIDDLPADQPGDWPPLEAIRAWAASARAQVDARCEHLSALEAMTLVEHRFMHVETLSYLFEQLGPGLRTVPRPLLDEGSAPDQRWVEISAGPVVLGRRRAESPLGWCNEFEGFEAQVRAFRIEARKTTNGDWLRFVEEGGYRERRFWSDESWAWRERLSLEAPASWRRRGDSWGQWVNGHELSLRSSWPVYVSHAEASAYAAFRRARLPTEAEWHRAVHGAPGRETRDYPWGDAAPVPGVHGNFGFAHRHPTRVGAHPAGMSAFGLDEPVGNGWEWTASPFAPFEGYQPAAIYPGYSAPFFDGHHFVLAGASAVTATPLLRRSFRNWYQPHYRPGFSTVRLATDAEAP